MDKRYDHLSSEKSAQDLWEQNQIYAFAPQSQKPIFSIDTPPPTISGTLHIGHIFSYSHTDIIARYKRMRGYNVFYPMGFDDNGLATERFVEKKRCIRGSKMARSEFIKICLEESGEARKQFAHVFKQIGLSVDWSKTYSTIADNVRKISQYSFIDLYQKGLAYRKEEPSLYCTTCQTTVAQAELDSIEVATTFNDLHFTGPDGQKLTIATTRPELLPACVAVFFHPDDTRYQALAGKQALTPIFNQQVPIIADELVNPEKGSGLVMCCTFGDHTDVSWYKKHQLSSIQAVGRDGKWTSVTGPLAGLNVHEARKKILELLTHDGTLAAQRPIHHHVHTHERCKHEIEYFTLSQWFINILDHKKAFLDRADQITWYPEFMKARYKDWVTNLSWDWGISRQRFFGVPFPVWHCSSCKEIMLARPEDLPVDPQEQSYVGKTCTKCGSDKLVADTDVMDTWNTSSITPQINMGWPDNQSAVTMPMSMRPQAHDIIRTWAFDTIVKAHYHHQRIPWTNIVISGHVLAGKEKISKSQGNTAMNLDVLLANHPADAIRFWAASSKLGLDTAFSENQLKIGNKLITKLWNALRFAQDIAPQYIPQARQEPDLLNAWMLNSLGQTVQHYCQAFDQFDYGKALEVVDDFFWNTFCDNYLELMKDRLFHPDRYSPYEHQVTRHALLEASFALLQLYSPFLPYLTESLYQEIFKVHEKSISLHSCLFEPERFAYQYKDHAMHMETILNIINQVRKLKSENHLSLKTELVSLTICGSDEKNAQQCREQEMLITGITKAQSILFVHNAFQGSSSLVQKDDGWHATVSISAL